MNVKSVFLYECTMFDRENNLCTAHNDRPPVCRDFPWYGKEPGDWVAKYLPNCSYIEDVPINLITKAQSAILAT